MGTNDMRIGSRFQHVLFDERVHTSITLAEQLTSLCDQEPSLRIAGSLGRMAFFKSAGMGANREFATRGQSLVSKRLGQRSVARDIDLIGVNSKFKSHDDAHFPIDLSAYCSSSGMIAERDGDWWLVADRHGFAERINGDMMLPFAGALEGRPFNTLQPPMHYAILRILGDYRSEKIHDIAKFLEQTLEDQNIKYSGAELVPFTRLGQLNSDDMRLKLRHAYRRRVSGPVRERLVFASRLVSKLID